MGLDEYRSGLYADHGKVAGDRIIPNNTKNLFDNSFDCEPRHHVLDSAKLGVGAFCLLQILSDF